MEGEPASVCPMFDGHSSNVGPGLPADAAVKAASIVLPGSQCSVISSVEFDIEENNDS
jgi:hypothetical protein